MNWGSWALWGFVATIVLTTLMAGSQGLGFTRMNLPYMLGSMFTPSRDRAKLIGFFLHLINGWLFSLIYVAAFHLWGANGTCARELRSYRWYAAHARSPPANGQ